MNKNLEIYNELYNEYKLQDWAKQVKNKYNHTCQHCGKENLEGRQCHTHHIKDKKIYPLEMYDLKNGICLCIQCHMRLHQLSKLTNINIIDYKTILDGYHSRKSGDIESILEKLIDKDYEELVLIKEIIQSITSFKYDMGDKYKQQ